MRYWFFFIKCIGNLPSLFIKIIQCAGHSLYDDVLDNDDSSNANDINFQENCCGSFENLSSKECFKAVEVSHMKR